MAGRNWRAGSTAAVSLLMAVCVVAAPVAPARADPPRADTLSALVDSSLQPVNSTKALKKAEESVVRVLVIYRGFGGVPLDTVGMGSGFVVAPGFIVTNYHVVEVPPEASSADIYIVPHKDSGEKYQAVQLVKTWMEGDLALLEAKGLKASPLTLHLNPYKNERVVTMGYPDVTDHLLNRSGTQLLVPADAYVTQGSIALFAATNPDGSKVDTLFHTAPLNHGNSGGPLLNECGQVVGVNTWSAPSTVSSTGDVDISAGQFVATHVSALNTFLSSAGISPVTATEPCYAKTEDQIVKDDALTRVLAAAADAQRDRLAEQSRAEADRALMERLQLAALIVLSLLVLVLIGLIIRREIRHKEELHHREPDAPTAFSSEPAAPARKAKPVAVAPAPKKKLKHPIPWLWIALGLIIVIVVLAFLVTDRNIYKRLQRPAATAVPTATAHLVCEVDRQASPKPITAAGPIEFDFDAEHTCVAGRTPYERQSDGSLLRFTVSDNEAARLELSADGARFKRSDYRLDPAAQADFLAQRAALGSLRCVTSDDAGAATALKDNLAKVRVLSQRYLTVPPAYETVWRCQKK